MRKISLLSFCLLLFISLAAQFKVGNNPQSVNTSVLLELESTSKGFLPPRMTNVQRDAVSNPPQGLIIFNTTTNCLQSNIGNPLQPLWKCMSMFMPEPVLLPSSATLLKGSTYPGCFLFIDVNSDGLTDFTSVASSNGSFNKNISPPLANGTIVSIYARDSLGNTSTTSQISIDAQAPAAPVVFPTNGSSIGGVAESLSVVLMDVNNDGLTDYEVTADFSGNFNQQVSPQLAHGTVVSVRVRDASGNTSVPATVIVDRIAPAIPVLNPSNGTVIAGTSEALSTVLIDVNGDSIPDYTSIADGNGYFSQTMNPFLANGVIVRVRASDIAGNISQEAIVVIDNQAPSLPIIYPTYGADVSGTAEPNSVVLIDINGDGITDYTTPVDGNGNYMQTVNPPLQGGTLVNVRARDIAGNISLPASVTVYITGLITGLDCSGAVPSAKIYAGQTGNSITVLIPYTGGNGGNHEGQIVTGTGTTGLTAALLPGVFNTGNGTLTYTISGTPSAAGIVSFALNIGGQSCNLVLTVWEITSVPAGAGSFSGQTCFDIAISNDNTNNCATLLSRNSRKSDFTNPIINTQAYTFTPTGTVSNVRFMYRNSNGNVITNISGDNNGNDISTPVTATVNLNPALNTLALGLTNSNPLIAEVTVVYNDGASNNGTERQFSITLIVKDCACCGAATTTGQWLPFQCQNLGASTTIDPFTYAVGNPDGTGGTLGYLFQWGRQADGHQLRNSTSTNLLATSTVPGHNQFIRATIDWINVTGFDNRWGDGTTGANPPKAPNDPCPAGWKIPSISQWRSIFRESTINAGPASATANTWTWTGNGFKVGNSLYLPAAGYRDRDATFFAPGTTGLYWSSTKGTVAGYGTSFNITSATIYPGVGNYRSRGFSVRCIPQ